MRNRSTEGDAAAQRLEVAPVQRSRLDRVECDRTRRANRSIVEQGLLAERCAGPEHGERDHVAGSSRHANGDVALVDHVQGVAGVSGVEQRVVLAEGAPRHRRQQRATVVGVELVEQPAAHPAEPT